jgi:hypothetical protein
MYSGLTEGFDAPSLNEAKALLKELEVEPSKVEIVADR